MKRKFLIIGILLALLVFTVYKMLEYEESIREARLVTEYIEDDSKPLITQIGETELQEMAARADYYFRVDGDYFKHLKVEFNQPQSHWQPILFKGVNMGVALPGKFPSEFSMTYQQYFEWLKMIGQMNANVIRTYTILPPDFYDALAQYNMLHHDKPLYLMQGVWATVPNDHNYHNASYSRNLKKEIVNVIDVLHGHAVIEPQPGKAAGVYASDVSQYVAAILFGREWEPDGVHFTNLNSNQTGYNGHFISVKNGNPMEVWLAQMLDFTVLYETQTYQMQHPVSFVNWLPLDPLFHNTEIIENERVREYDNDMEKIDFNHFHYNNWFVPGIFASYHAYPYYPDFVYLNPEYAQVETTSGHTSSYAAYLNHLKTHHAGMPLIISEYGVPSSRGNSHTTPSGFDQGGHSEAAHAHKNLLLTKDIFETGCAGAIFFEWADEWFKHNWLVMDFEQPFHDRKLWHNMENPEQNFGILALESRTKTIDGRLDDWDNGQFAGTTYRYASAADAGYFYLAFQLPGFDFDLQNFFVALDVFDKNKGDHRLPFSQKRWEYGFEFLLEFNSTLNARILVDEPYSVFTDIYNNHVPVYASAENDNGKYIEQLMLTNRSRESLLGQKFDSLIISRSHLVHGNTALPEASNADWCWNPETHTLEVRLTWHLLNVSDPAKQFVLDDKAGTPEIEYSLTEGFNMLAFITDTAQRVQEQLPNGQPAFLTWETWENPQYQSRLKPLYDTLQNYFRTLGHKAAIPTGRLQIAQNVTVCPFFNNKKAAVSFSFDNAAFSQYEQALPVLQKYDVDATFGLIPQYLDETPGMYQTDPAGRVKRLSLNEVREMQEEGHQFAFQSGTSAADKVVSLSELKTLLETPVLTGHLPPYESPPAGLPLIFWRQCDTVPTAFRHRPFDYTAVAAGALTLLETDSILKHNEWTILVYTYFSNRTGNRNSQPETYRHTAPQKLERQLRLARNYDYWLAPEADVAKYIEERNAATIEVVQHNNLVFVTVHTGLNPAIYNHALTLRFPTTAPFVEVSGATANGIYTNRNNEIIFNAMPEQEVTLKLID